MPNLKLRLALAGAELKTPRRLPNLKLLRARHIMTYRPTFEIVAELTSCTVKQCTPGISIAARVKGVLRNVFLSYVYVPPRVRALTTVPRLTEPSHNGPDEERHLPSTDFWVHDGCGRGRPGRRVFLGDRHDQRHVGLERQHGAGR